MSLQNFLIMHLLFWLKDHAINPTLMRFSLMNLRDVYSYQSLRLDRQCTLLMERILTFSFSWVLFTPHPLFKPATQANFLLLCSPNSLVSPLISAWLFFMEKYVLKFYHQSCLRLKQESSYGKSGFSFPPIRLLWRFESSPILNSEMRAISSSPSSLLIHTKA